jgi:hypothetical protein
MSVPAFKTEKVSERITRIYAFSSELMYLVEGDDRAALLDSGSGIGFVRPLVEQLTQKPVIVLLTHGHGKSDPGIIGENIALCSKILDQTADKEPMEFRGHHGLIANTKAEPGHGNIVYNPDNLR